MTSQPPIPGEGARSQLTITTTSSLEGYRIERYLGVVRGLIVRAPTITQEFFGTFKSLVGGRIESYTEMCEQARQQAFDLMIEQAHELGANAVVGFRYDAAEAVSRFSATEVLCYGTAVVVTPLPS